MSDAADTDALFVRLREHIAAARGGERDRGSAASTASLRAQIDQLEHLARVGETLPAFGHLGTIRRAVARRGGRLLLYFLRLVTVEQRRFNGATARLLRMLPAAWKEDLDTLRRQLEVHSDRHIRQLRDTESNLRTLGREMTAAKASLSGLGELIEKLREQWSTVDETSSALLPRLLGFDSALAEMRADLDDLRRAMRLLQTRLEGVQLRVDASAPTRSPSAPADDGAVPPYPAPGPLPTAEMLRGGEEEIAARHERYLEIFTGRRAVLDLGCGRGRFLERLRAKGVPAHGVDADVTTVLLCRDRGLDVIHADALAYLAKAADGAFDGIFCAQVVEHLATPSLVALIHEAARTLQAGAPLVIETLNPESLLVLYRWYWVDLDHQRLVHPTALELVLRDAGFQSVRHIDLPPAAGPLHLPILSVPGVDRDSQDRFNAATQYLNRLLYASYDYAVVAIR